MTMHRVTTPLLPPAAPRAKPINRAAADFHDRAETPTNTHKLTRGELVELERWIHEAKAADLVRHARRVASARRIQAITPEAARLLEAAVEARRKKLNLPNPLPGL